MTTVFADLPTKIDDADLGEVPLTKKERERVCFTKYESHNPMVSDTVHHGTWDITVTSDKNHGDKLGLTEDDGVIINFQGTPRGEVAITNEGSILTDEEADILIALGQRLADAAGEGEEELDVEDLLDEDSDVLDQILEDAEDVEEFLMVSSTVKIEQQD